MKGAVTALLITIGAILVFALIIKSTQMQDSAIAAFNQIVKIVSVFVGAIVASKGMAEKYMRTGAFAGGLYVALCYLVFSLIEGEFGSIPMLLADLAMGIVVGLITALIFGKLLKKDGAKTPRRAS